MVLHENLHAAQFLEINKHNKVIWGAKKNVLQRG